MIKVSVIMPVYNAERYLKETLECLVNQTLKEIEIICIDDGSTDQSHKILDKYAQMDSRIMVLFQENSGAGVARNLGLQYAKGEYLSILDADDIFEPDMLEAAYLKAKKDQVDICVFKMDRFMEGVMQRQSCHWSLSKAQLPGFEPFTYKDISENIFKVFVGWTWDKLFRREFVNEQKLEFQPLRTTNDMFFTFSALVKAKKISILSRTLVHQRVNLKTSLSSTREKSWDCFYKALVALREELIRMNIYKEVERSYINYALHFSIWNLDTLGAPAFQELYEKLKIEYFKKLDIEKKNRNYFWDQEEYWKYRQIKSISPREYRISNGLEIRYMSSLYQVRHMERAKNPKVSILIPVYNVEIYLAECLNSVVNQTLDDIEIICINDGSTDQSLDIIKKYALDDKRIIILDGPNGGYGKAMNRGLKIARGEYVGIVEPDDYVDINMYETLYKIAIKENLDLIKADFNRFVDGEKKREFTLNKIAYDNIRLYRKVVSPKKYPIVFKFIMNTWSGIYRRSFLINNQIYHNETPGASYQDNGFWFQTFCYAERMYFLDQPLYQNRRDNPNSSVYDKTKVFCMCEEYQYIYNFLEKHPEFMQRYVGYYQFRKYHNYMANFNKISDERKLEFINQFYEEFKLAYEKNELHEEIFGDLDWDRIQELIANPTDFYAHNYAYGYIEETLQLRQQIKWIHASRAWKLGKAIVYFPKKIKGKLVGNK